MKVGDESLAGDCVGHRLRTVCELGIWRLPSPEEEHVVGRRYNGGRDISKQVALGMRIILSPKGIGEDS